MAQYISTLICSSLWVGILPIYNRNLFTNSVVMPLPLLEVMHTVNLYQQWQFRQQSKTDTCMHIQTNLLVYTSTLEQQGICKCSGGLGLTRYHGDIQTNTLSFLLSVSTQHTWTVFPHRESIMPLMVRKFYQLIQQDHQWAICERQYDVINIKSKSQLLI